MAEPKTVPTAVSVEEFLDAVPDQRRRADARAVGALLHEVTGEPPAMWGTSIVGYGAVDYPAPKGKTKQWPVIAFSPRKAELVLYLNQNLEADLFASLGPHRRGVGCLYIKRLDAVDTTVLRRLIERSVELARA